MINKDFVRSGENMKEIILGKEENDEITFQDLSKKWLFGKEIKVKQSTYEKYQYLLDRYILPYLGEIPAKGLNTQLVNRKIEELYFTGEKEHLSISIMEGVLYVIKAVLKYSRCIGKTDSIEITFELPSPSIEEIKTLSNVQIIQLLNCVSLECNDNNLGILITLGTGMRLGEVCSLQKKDIDFSNKLIYVRKTVQRLKSDGATKTSLVVTEPKSRKSYRVIPIPEFLYKKLGDYDLNKLEENQYILGRKNNPYDPRTLQYAFQRVLKKCKIDHIKFHSLRHTFATNCVRNGFDIKTLSEILGHSTVNFTMNRYVHSDLERKREQMKLMDKVFGE